jgi:hypothetical protein
VMVNVCSTYVTTAAPGCSANFTQRKSISSSNKTSVATAADALDNKGNAPSGGGAQSPLTALSRVAQGLLKLGSGSQSPSQARLEQLNRAGVKKIQTAAAKDSSAALDGVSGHDEALLSYLMGSD